MQRRRIVSRMSTKPGLTTAIGLAVAAYRRDNASRFGAALAFYIVFSIAPTLLIAIAIAGSLFGRQQAEREILDRISGSFGSAAGGAIAAMIKDAATRRAGWLASLLGLMTLYFGLAGVYRQVDDALRTIWGRRPERRVGTIRTIRRRIGSMLLVIGAGVIVLVSVVADAVIAVTGRYAAARLVGADLLLRPRVHACLLAGAPRVIVVCCPALLPYTPDLPVATGAHEAAAARSPRAFAIASILRRVSCEDPRHDGCASSRAVMETADGADMEEEES